MQCVGPGPRHGSVRHCVDDVVDSEAVGESGHACGIDRSAAQVSAAGDLGAFVEIVEHVQDLLVLAGIDAGPIGEDAAHAGDEPSRW